MIDLRRREQSTRDHRNDAAQWTQIRLAQFVIDWIKGFQVGDHSAQVFVGDLVVLFRWHDQQRLVIVANPVPDSPDVVRIGEDAAGAAASGG